MVDYLVLPEGGAEGGGAPHLRAKCCTACGALFFDRRNGCAKCGGTEFGAKDLSTDGTVRAFTIVHRAAPGVPVPYVSAVIDLDGGGSVKANVVEVDAAPDKVRLGMPVKLVTFPVGTDDEGTEAVAFGFAPVPTSKEA